MTIPFLNSAEHLDDFNEIFSINAANYVHLMTIVREHFYQGSVPGWENLDSRTIEVIRDITQSLIYGTETEFKVRHPEYRTTDDEIFIPYKSFKDHLSDALKEFLKPDQTSQGLS